MTYPYENLENFTLPSILDRTASLYADRDAFGKVGHKAMKYSEFIEKVHLMVALLNINGISKGDKVALLAENMPNWGIAYFAVTYFGAVIVPILPDFHPNEICQIIKHSEAKALFVSKKHQTTIKDCNKDSNIKFAINLENLEIMPELSSPSYISQFSKKTVEIAQKISGYSQEIPIVGDFIVVDELMDDMATITKDVAHGTKKMAQKLTSYSSNVSKPKENDLCAIIYTSGTTGHSKGVMLSHKNLVTNALSSFSVINIIPEDVFLSILPLAHTYECTVGLIIPVLHGSSVYYIDKVPTPTVLLKALEIVKPTCMLSVPLIIEKIYKNKVLPKFTATPLMRFLYNIPFIRKFLNKIAGKKLMQTFGGRMRFFAIGGASLSPFVEEFLIEAKFPYIIGYGLTETAPLLAGTPVGEQPRFKSTGPAMFGVEIKIKDKDPVSGEGEIVVKSPSVMMGYYKEKEKTAEVIENGWLLTGDLGYLDKDGYLFIKGRSKNVIIGAGGENIYPEQIESIINQHTAVIESLVLEHDNKLMARVCLDYELLTKKFNIKKDGDVEDRDAIEKYLEEMRLEINTKVSSFSKMAKFIEQREPFIKTPTKKIKRFLYKN